MLPSMKMTATDGELLELGSPCFGVWTGPGLEESAVWNPGSNPSVGRPPDMHARSSPPRRGYRHWSGMRVPRAGAGVGG
jgi:hypothetical protein